MVGKYLKIQKEKKNPSPMPFKCWHKRLQIDSGIFMWVLKSLFSMGEKAMLGLLSLSGRNMAESVPRHLGRAKFHRILIVSEQFITLLSCLIQYSCVDEIICWCLSIEDDRVFCVLAPSTQRLELFPYFYPICGIISWNLSCCPFHLTVMRWRGFLIIRCWRLTVLFVCFCFSFM